VTNRTVVALYDHFTDARDAVAASIQAGASTDRVTLFANSATGDHPALVTNPAFAREEYSEDSDKQSGTLTGMEFGIGIGGAAGVALAATAVVIPGIGPLAAFGAWAVAAAAAAGGGIVGGIIGALTSHGVSDEDAHLFAEGVRRGATLTAIVVDESLVEPVTQIAKTHGAVDIGKRSADWRAGGWVGFDLNAHPLTAEELRLIREREDAAGHEADHHHAIRHYFHPGHPGHFQGGGASNEMTHYAEDRTRT
jgi:hypothetical protein